MWVERDGAGRAGERDEGYFGGFWGHGKLAGLCFRYGLGGGIGGWDGNWGFRWEIVGCAVGVQIVGIEGVPMG